MDELISILMRRDDLTEEEAYRVVEDCVDSVRTAIGQYASISEIEDIVAYDLGLEPDYLDIILNELI